MSDLTTLEKCPIMSIPAIDDDFDDGCSICLDPFSPSDPSSATSCKHEYHLHCILEWSQRSKECPICWQSLSLKDPASQELLAAVEIERNARQRRASNNVPSYLRLSQESDSEDGSHWTDDSDFNERIMRHLSSVMSRARQAQRNERRRSSDRSPSPVFMFPASLSESSMHPNTPEECNSAYGSSGGSSPTPSISSIDARPPLSPSPSSGSAPRRVIYQPSRSPESQSPECTQKPRSSELFAFSDSIKSKLSAASAKYKDSISKSTQGFKDKLLARNSSVKEMSKGVQREMSASIAGVSRMIERLDLKSKRNLHSGGVTRVGETSNFLSKGKGMLDQIIASSREDRVATERSAADVHHNTQATCPFSSRKDVT